MRGYGDGVEVLTNSGWADITQIGDMWEQVVMAVDPKTRIAEWRAVNATGGSTMAEKRLATTSFMTSVPVMQDTPFLLAQERDDYIAEGGGPLLFSEEPVVWRALPVDDIDTAKTYTAMVSARHAMLDGLELEGAYTLCLQVLGALTGEWGHDWQTRRQCRIPVDTEEKFVQLLTHAREVGRVVDSVWDGQTGYVVVELPHRTPTAPTAWWLTNSKVHQYVFNWLMEWFGVGTERTLVVEDDRLADWLQMLAVTNGFMATRISGALHLWRGETRPVAIQSVTQLPDGPVGWVEVDTDWVIMRSQGMAFIGAAMGA